jgi:hypothetical protein
MDNAKQPLGKPAQLLTRRELAERWSMSTQTIRARERCGFLPFLRLCRDIRYRLADVERLESEATARETLIAA